MGAFIARIRGSLVALGAERVASVALIVLLTFAVAQFVH